MKLIPGLEVPKQVQILMAEVQAFIQIVLNVVGKADAVVLPPSQATRRAC